MPHDRIEKLLSSQLGALEAEGRRKRAETVIKAVLPPDGVRGPRFLIEGQGDKPFLRMNANNYLGFSFLPEIIAADEAATRAFGTGPGAVRFISGSWAPHIELEQRLAKFHGREAAMLFSSAYATMLGVLVPLITPKTAVISDALNHNCIINAIRLAQPAEKHVYRHLDMDELDACLRRAAEKCLRAIVVTDGVFSMRGDHAPLQKITEIARTHDSSFPENVLVVVDDSHGVGAFGASGRGTEEETLCRDSDLLVGTLGKAIGVNGGYVAAGRMMIEYLRETSPLYIYSNPITPGEAAAAAKALEILDGPRGLDRLRHLREMTARFAAGLAAIGFETIPGRHPIVPLLVRDTERTLALVRHLRANGILATGLSFPVVPRGEEEIRFQICADHTPADIDEALGVLGSFDRMTAA
jgi:glycine C-acetyltransferase